MDDVLRLCNVNREFANDGVVTKVLHDINLEVSAGELTAMIGPSGSGKSTLLNIIGLLMRPTSGQVWLGGEEASAMRDKELTRLRGRKIGFIFQFHHLIAGLSAAENLMMPLMIERGSAAPGMRERALAGLTAVGLGERADARPNQLSGGQQQRVAVARALVNRPPLVLADEPTGNLDTESSRKVFELMRRYNREENTAFLIVTHNLAIAEQCARVVEIIDGRIHSDSRNKTARS